MEILKIVIIGLCAVLLILILDQQKEFGVYISIAVGACVFFIVLDKLSIILMVVDKISNLIVFEDIYLKLLMQVVGIAFVTEFGADICIDAGQKAIAKNIELAGKIIILVISMPVILAIIELIEDLV
jgi:stage III sporulation protein AD